MSKENPIIHSIKTNFDTLTHLGVNKQPRLREEYSEINGLLIKRVGTRFVLLANSWKPLDERLVSSERIPFAEGRCLVVGSEDNKIVLADQDGMSSRVIKIYKAHNYTGEHAREKADFVAGQMQTLYTVIRNIAGDYVLPTEIRVGSYYDSNGQENVGVYELQQRAILASPWIFDTDTARRLIRDGRRAKKRFSPKIAKELRRNRIDSYGGAGAPFVFAPGQYDFVTNHSVAIDIIDGINLPE